MNLNDVKPALRFGCRQCDLRFASIRERNEHEEMNEACEPRTIPCIRCGEESVIDQWDYATCTNHLCNTTWTA